MKTGNDIVIAASHHIGEKYVLGALAPKDHPDYHGSWDCAEFTAYINYQLTGSLAGCRNMDAYTGYYKADADKGLMTKIPVSAAASIPGAMLLRFPLPGTTGHIAFSDGSGGTVEAHSTKRGVIRSVVSGRVWHVGLLLHGVDYSILAPVQVVAPKIVYKLQNPYMTGPVVEQIQRALNLPADGVFGPDTHAAVVGFQKKNGLLVDGMVGKDTLAELQIKI